MRKLLLGTTAVVGAALLAPEMAAAQEAPTVRVGGYFRAYYGYTQQTSPNVTGTTPQGSVNQPVLAGDTQGAAGAAPNASAAQSARTGKHDFSTDAEIHVFVNGKTANGLTYGAVVEMQFDNNEGTFRAARRSYTSKTGADIDEMYAFIASPTLGQVRFGDEDGPFGGRMEPLRRQRHRAAMGRPTRAPSRRSDEAELGDQLSRGHAQLDDPLAPRNAHRDPPPDRLGAQAALQVGDALDRVAVDVEDQVPGPDAACAGRRAVE